ncbi:S8 family serine peptidase [Methylopila sp. M107]|uniref:S8 family serine peptidase n=1 Tax=Methylopila sp. M107 TaxID=1101190 RepID=UPI00035C7091|nr:S8 family serine peptidase [Methylopila sp. M107]
MFEDIQFQVLPGNDDDAFRTWDIAPGGGGGGGGDDVGLRHVVEQIRAPQAWSLSRGSGVTIAVVDTGVDKDLREVNAARRHPANLRTAYVGKHWDDEEGHGSMCAAIAAGSKSGGGYFDGVAPEATVLSARTTLGSTDLFDVYDELILAKSDNRIAGPLVITNSYGLYVCSTPNVMPQDHPFLANVLSAIDAGAFVCFAAGNNHVETCSYDPTQCGPNSIWGPNSHDRVVSVGTVDRNLSNRDNATPHVDSSRGPGEWAREFPKPDCVAPTYGMVPWGGQYTRMDWWGTSGACPQVAGLAALLLSLRPALQPGDAANVIRDSCRTTGAGPGCVGRGVINCEAAIGLLASSQIALDGPGGSPAGLPRA